jgi:hypothetical protein
MIMDHYVAIRPWTTDFISSQVKINKTLVWIRFPSLGMEYYDESLLLALATAVGTPVKVDMHTLDASRGKFARVCIEIDLDKPVVGKVWFRDFWYHVEYEGLHLLCKSCGIYGHVARNCPTKAVREEKNSMVSAANDALDGVEGMTKNAALMVAPTNEVLNKESPQAEAGIKEDDLYGDWLVVTRKKNQGRKTSPQNQVINMRSKGDSGKKLNGKGFFFSHLNEAGKQFSEENEKLSVVPQFHSGGVWITIRFGLREIKGPVVCLVRAKSPMKMTG